MSASIEAGAARKLGHRALSLGAAGAFDYAIQFLLPVVLVRCLDAEAFGQYRLLWLVVGTVMAFLPMAMQASLHFYLPRSDADTKRLYINQTLLCFIVLGLVAAWAVSGLNPWLPAKISTTLRHPLVVPAFVLLWVIASVLDLLPTVEERVRWQAKVTVGLALVRAASLSLAAIFTGQLLPVLLALLAFVLFKVGLLLRYIYVHHGLRAPFVDWQALAGQLKYTAPFWIGGLLYGLRAQADQWVAASLFPLAMFASFSVAAVLGPFVHLCRQSVANVFMPSMSRLQAAGGVAGMLELNGRANVMVAALVLPMLALAFAFAEDIITIVYTQAYVDAAPVMRVFIAGFAALVVELAGITLLLRLGNFMMAVNLAGLLIAIAVNWYGAKQLGLAGAAVGTVLVIYLDRIATLICISRKTAIPLHRLQDWRMLALLAAISALSALIAWGIVEYFAPAASPLLRVIAGGLLLAVAYGSLRASLGMDREIMRAAWGRVRRS